MTGLLLSILGLASTGLVHPNYQGFDPALQAIEQYEQQIIDEAERNYQAEQQEIIIEDYFLFLSKIGKIKYARGCMGKYTPARRSEEKQKYVKCSDNAFDCAGLVKGYAIAKGILGSKEVSHYNSQTLMSLAKPKDARTAQRGDRTSRQGYGDRSTGNLSTHFAIVSRDYTGGNTLRIYDNVNGPNNNIVAERPIKVVYNRGMFHYLGKYRIYVYTNGLVDAASTRGIEVERWVDTDEEEVPMSQVDPLNPAGYSATVKGFAYDSLANRIASFRIDNGGTKYMVAKFTAEAHFNLDATGKAGEKGICQLIPNKTNNVWINDPLWDTREYQAKVCLDKWNAVPEKNRDVIRQANAYTEMDNIILHTK